MKYQKIVNHLLKKEEKNNRGCFGKRQLVADFFRKISRQLLRAASLYNHAVLPDVATVCHRSQSGRQEERARNN